MRNEQIINQIYACTTSLGIEDVHELIRGKTEKKGGIDPVRLLSEEARPGRQYRVGRIPIDVIDANSAGDLYDGTVGITQAYAYAGRSPEGAPPIIALQGRGAFTGRLHVLDGGHRVTAARWRGDATIYAVVEIDSQRIEGKKEIL